MRTPKTRKRKLALKDFSRCNPAATRKSTTKCLPSNIYSKISKNLGTKPAKIFEAVGCNDGEEHCLLDKAPLDEDVKKQLRKQYLRPRRPKAWEADPDMWLDNYNILHVMKQYEEAYGWFKFLGVFPIDFSAPDPYLANSNQAIAGAGAGAGLPKQCLYRETCELNLQDEYNKGVRGIGMIFNLDPHFKSGSHWVALYINLTNIKKPFVGYFDSYAYKVPPLIARLMRSFKIQIKTCELGTNARRFQYGDSECGMFSMYFIICMICGISFRDFCKDSVNDNFMLELRKVLFSK
jgi:Ulp1 protease family, C-terminal catalytic domain